MFRPPIKKLRLVYFYSNLSKCGTRVNEVQSTDTTLVHKHEQQTIKKKSTRVREEKCKYKITRRCVIKEETEELGEKSLRRPLSDKSIY